jgi:hypothetical protein
MEELPEDKITSEQKEELKKSIEEFREAIKERDLDKIEEKQKEVEKLWNPIAEDLYKSEQQNGQSENNPFTGSNPFSGFTGNSNPFAQ